MNETARASLRLLSSVAAMGAERARAQPDPGRQSANALRFSEDLIRTPGRDCQARSTAGSVLGGAAAGAVIGALVAPRDNYGYYNNRYGYGYPYGSQYSYSYGSQYYPYTMNSYPYGYGSYGSYGSYPYGSYGYYDPYQY